MLPGDDGAQLQCCVTVEHLNTSGQATRRQVIRKASVTLGRNEFQEIILRVHDGKVPQSYNLKDIKLFTKFVRDGKCTVKLLPENIQVLISNCPPDRLNLFLKTLSIKHQAWQGGKPMSDREKLKAGLPRSFEAISPLQQKDIQKVNELRSKEPPKGLTERTNKMKASGAGQQVKRSRGDCNFSPVSQTSHIEFICDYISYFDIVADSCTLHSIFVSYYHYQLFQVKSNPSKKPILSLASRKLNKEQTAVLSAVLSGKNVFFTGSAGMKCGAQATFS